LFEPRARVGGKIGGKDPGILAQGLTLGGKISHSKESDRGGGRITIASSSLS